MEIYLLLGCFHPLLRCLRYVSDTSSLAREILRIITTGFGAGWSDLPPIFGLGLILGFLNYVVAEEWKGFRLFFEFIGALLAALCSRILGSVYEVGGEASDSRIFCFASMTQASIALILPGYIMLLGSLELMHKRFIPGAVRMVFCVFYAMYLAFAIMLGTALAGYLTPDPVSATTCAHPGLPFFPHRCVAVALFAVPVALLNGGAPAQSPIMVAVALATYAPAYRITLRTGSPQLGCLVGAFAGGLVANLHSRFLHGVAAANLIPAVFVLVPSGVSIVGSLREGLLGAEQLDRHEDVSTVLSPTSFRFLFIASPCLPRAC